jgi:hypothetical protein
MSAINAGIVETDMKVVSKCRCGRSYTLTEWKKLQYVGIMDDRDIGGEIIELRNCSKCGSTIAI